MSLYEMPNLSSGMDEAIIGTASAVPGFAPMFLLFVFFVVFLGGMGSQKRRIGTADAPMWAVVSSLSVLMISLALSLREGLIQTEVLGVVVAVTLLSGLWLFTSRNKNEV